MRSSRERSHVTSFLFLVLALGCSSESGSGNAAVNGGASGQIGMAGSTGTAGIPAAGGTISSGGTGTGGGTMPGGSGSAGRGGSTDAGSGGAANATGGAAGSVSGGAGGAPDVSGAIYVAPNGADTNPGTMSQPVKTVAKARDLVRAMTASMSADITVYLRGGTYPLASTLTFANADSGKNGFYVKYMAYPGEQPIITGGKAITGWTMSDAGNGIYSASAVTTPFRQLYVNGVKAIRARAPNLGPNGAFAFNRLTGADNGAQNIQVAASEVATWNNLTKVEMHVMTGWGDNTLRLASFTTSGNTAFVKVQSPEDTIVFTRPFPHLGGQFGGFTRHFYYFENALEFLDQPGEWYLDETKSVLYYKPRTGEDMTKAVVVTPMVETLLSIKGTSTTDQMGHLWFQGITFAHSTYMRPSQAGFCDGQAGQYNLTATADNKQTVGHPPSGVSVMNANHVHFERNIFTQMGATALDFVSGTHDDVVIGNVFTDIAGNGISVGKFTASEATEYHVPYNPADQNEICTNETIKNNYVHHVTTEFQGGIGIVGGYPRQISIEHNEIAYVNYSGISVGYGWTSTVNAMKSNKINYNDLHHVVQIMADGAAIYTLSNQQPASEMQYNYLHDYVSSQWADYGSNGIYLDEQTAGYTVAHNAMVNAPTNVVRNQNGMDTITDTPAANPSSVMAMAGIETAYADIKKATIPAAAF
jgi:hypothetical protein